MSSMRGLFRGNNGEGVAETATPSSITSPIHVTGASQVRDCRHPMYGSEFCGSFLKVFMITTLLFLN